MLGKTAEVKVSRPRDGRHCDLCGCSFPAVRCDKCGTQIFCLSCDDMYHRHPKRRFHLRKAVDPTPTPQARPVLPMKVSQLASTPGDPSKMPLPPPRKKKPGKSFFDSFRRGSPSSDNSPPLPKKEYSWTDRLGSIKKFMSNRPLPPLPKDDDSQEQRNSPSVPRKNDLSFIHKRVDEKPPQLPHRMQAKSPTRKLSDGDVVPLKQESNMADKHAEWASGFGTPTNNFRQTSAAPLTQHLNGQASRDSSARELFGGRFRSRSLQEDMSSPGIPNFPEQPNLSPTMPPDVRGYSTLKRPPSHSQDIHNQSFLSMPGDHFPGMHTSSSFTDLHSIDSPTARGPQQFSNFPLPPHYPHPYPMYPHYPNYPQYFGTSFANLATGLPNADGDFSDHSEASGFGSKKHHKHSAFGIKAKRSQSVMYDRMAYPPQYYPFGGFPPHPPLPGYGAAPWGQSDHPGEAPSSPATSVRSFGRSHRSRHRKKKMVASENDDEDERLSVRSSPRSRTTSSSDRLRKRKMPKKFERSASPSSLTSSEEEEENQTKEDRLSPDVHMELEQGDGYQTKQDKKKVNKQVKDATKSEHKNKQHGTKTKAASQQKLKTDDKNFSPKFKKKEKVPLSSSESMDISEEQGQAIGKTEDVQNEQYSEMREESSCHSEEDGRVDTQVDEPRNEPSLTEGQWQCEHCTFINNADHRICQVCCKTKPGAVPQSDSVSLAVPETQASSSTAASPDIPALNTTSESLTSDTAKEYMTPPAADDEDSHSIRSENEGQNFEKLNSDLEQAEKELSRGLMELMKLKEESDIASARTSNRRVSDDIPATIEALTAQNIQPEPNLVVPEMAAPFSQLTAEIQATSEQMNHHPNVLKTENVSKSIGTDSMDLDLSPLQTHAPQIITAPAATTANFGSYTQGQISQSNSFPDITPLAPSSQRETTVKPTLRRDSSCQTYQDDAVSQTENEIHPLSHAENMDFQYPYNRVDSMKSPQLPPMAPSSYRGFGGRGQGLMHRSHSRSSLFGDRYSDSRPVPPDFDNLGFGFGPSPMYRSLSRSSLTGDYSDPWMSDARSLRRPDFYLSMEELVERRRLETKRAQGLELVRMIRDAEQQGFTADDIHVALNNCGKQNPVDWLQTNWRGMVDTVVTLATNYGKDKHENDIGVLSENEARDALRMHKGNIWAAVTECVEGRQRKFLELKARGNFSTKEIADVLAQSEGNVELAYTRLSATTLKPFLMRIWGAGEGVENQDGAVCDPTEFLDPGSSGWPKNSTLRGRNISYGDTERCSDQEDWDDDDEVEEEVSWNEDEEDEMENPENFDIEPQTINREKRSFALNHIATPESDSEYCDAFDPVGDARSATSSSPVDEIIFASPDNGTESQKDKKKGTSFLSRLAALRKNKKPQMEDVAEKDFDHLEQSKNHETGSCNSPDVAAKHEQRETKIRSNNSQTPNAETSKIYGPLNILKQTFSAIKDSVIGSNNKNEAKHPRSITEARTIIVHDRTGQEVLLSEENAEKTDQKLLDHSELKNEEINKITDESDYKKKEPGQLHTSKNMKDNSLNKVLPTTFAIMDTVQVPNSSTSLSKVLPTTSAIMDDVQVPNVSTSVQEIIRKKQIRDKSSDSEAKNAKDTVNNLNHIQENFKSLSSEKKSSQEDSTTQILTMTPPLKSVKDRSKNERKPLTPNTLERQIQDDSNSSEDMKFDIEDSSTITEQSPPKRSQGDKFPAETERVDAQDKILDVVDNTGVDIKQTSLLKSGDVTSSNEVAIDAGTKNDLVTILQNDTKSVTNTNDTPITSAVGEAEKSRDTPLIKNNDAKPKLKRQKEGLRLKLPDLERTTKTKLDGPKGEFPDKPSPKTDVQGDQKQKALKKESDKIVPTTTESQTVFVGKGKMLQKPERDESTHAGEDILPRTPDDKSFDTNMGGKSEGRSATAEKSDSRLSENEFHHMVSKITEKMENCLEVLKSSEADFTETEPNISPGSEKDQEMAVENETKQNKASSPHQNSEIAQGNGEKSTTDVSEISISHEKAERNDVGGASSLSLNQNEKPHPDNANQNADAVKESSETLGKRSPSDAIEKRTIPDGKSLEQPSTSSAVLDQNIDGVSLAINISDKTSPKDSVEISITKQESTISQVTSTTPTTNHSDNSVEIPVKFAGVKAKTFTGVINKKAKSHLPGSDENQKDVCTRSPAPKTTLGVIRSDNSSTGMRDSLDQKQTAANGTDIYDVEQVPQPHQNEIEQHVHSITIGNEEKSSPFVAEEELSQATPEGNKNEVLFPAQTVHTKIDSGQPGSSETRQIKKEVEESAVGTPATMDTVITEGRSESKLERSDSDSQKMVQDTKNVFAGANIEALVSTSNKVSESQTKEQDPKNTSLAINSEASVSTSIKGPESQTKEQDTENALTTADSETVGTASSQDDELNMEIKEITETIPVEEDNIPSPLITSGDRRPASRVDALKNSFNDVRDSSQGRSQSPLRPQSPFGRMTSLSARKEAIAQERNKEVRRTPTTEKKPWFIEKVQPPKPIFPKKSIKQQLEFERRIRKLVSERKCRTYRKAEIVVQLLELNFAEDEALQAAHECSNLEQAISYLQQECLLCTGMYPVGQIVSMIHCPHKACRECIKAYFTIQIRDRTIMELLCPFCNEPDIISDEDVAQDYFNHLDMLLKKLVESEIHELFQRKLRDRVLMKDPNFRWCSQCSSGFIAMPNLKRLICPDCNAITCASCRRPWERKHEGISCEAFAAWKDANDPEAQSAGLEKLLQEDGIDCPNCHFRYSLAKGGCMHFRCIQCQHDFCSGCSRPFKMGQKCGVSEYCGKLGLHAHHPRNCLFYLRDKDPEDLQRLLDLNDVDYNNDPPEGIELKPVCQVLEQKETPDGLVDAICGKEVLESQAGLCRVHYVEYLGQLVNKHKIDPIQIFCNDDLELVLRRASKRLPAKSYRENDVKYREKLVQLIQEELPLELTEGS